MLKMISYKHIIVGISLVASFLTEDVVVGQSNSFGLGQFGGQQFGGGFTGAGAYGGFGGGDFSQFQGVSASGAGGFNLNSLSGYGVPLGYNFGSQSGGFAGQGGFGQGGFGSAQGFPSAAGFPQGFPNSAGQGGLAGQQNHQGGQDGLNHAQLGAAGQFNQGQGEVINHASQLQGNNPGVDLSAHNAGHPTASPQPGQGAVLGQPGQRVLSPQQHNVPHPGHIGGAGGSGQHQQQEQHSPQHQPYVNPGHEQFAAQQVASQPHNGHQGSHQSSQPGLHHGSHGAASTGTSQHEGHFQPQLHQFGQQRPDAQYVNYNELSRYADQYGGHQFGLQVPQQYQQQVLGNTQHKDDGKGTASASSNTKFEGIPLEAFAQSHRDRVAFGHRIPSQGHENRQNEDKTSEEQRSRSSRKDEESPRKS